MKTTIAEKVCQLIESISDCDIDEKIEIINKIKMTLHEISPFNKEPVDCVLWIKQDEVQANDYNPNVVAPPEMKLLEHSITMDGYTQPIVAWLTNGHFEVIDGFHRNRVGRESPNVLSRTRGFLPLAIVNSERGNRGDRISSTIRHNRARGKHTVEGMSDIILELKSRNWTNKRIAKEMGMDEDEILRLCQITGLAGLFADADFSKSWEVEDYEDNFDDLSDDFDIYEIESERFRTVNTDDPDRIFHTHDKWECLKAGLYRNTMEGMTREECEQEYAHFLRDGERFSTALDHVIAEWKYSCEHYLTNKAMNRIAWLGQAAMCYATEIPAVFRGGFNLLTKNEQDKANKLALVYLNLWMANNKKDTLTMEDALEADRQMELY